LKLNQSIMRNGNGNGGSNGNSSGNGGGEEMCAGLF
jgi:hypothetical protein